MDDLPYLNHLAQNVRNLLFRHLIGRKCRQLWPGIEDVQFELGTYLAFGNLAIRAKPVDIVSEERLKREGRQVLLVLLGFLLLSLAFGHDCSVATSIKVGVVHSCHFPRSFLRG